MAVAQMTLAMRMPVARADIRDLCVLGIRVFRSAGFQRVRCYRQGADGDCETSFFQDRAPPAELNSKIECRCVRAVRFSSQVNLGGGGSTAAVAASDGVERRSCR